MLPHRTRRLSALFICALCICGALKFTVAVRSQNTVALRRLTVTPEPSLNLNPTLSGDGQHIAFESNAALTNDAATPTRLNAFSADLSSPTTTFQLLAHARSPAPALAQNGMRIVFAASDDPLGANADRNSEIFLRDGTGLTQLTATTPDDPARRAAQGNFQPSISDDGQLIVFASDRDLTGANPDHNSEIFLYDAQAARFNQLTDTAGVLGATAPKLSGDGTRVAFIHDPTASDAAASSATRDLLLYDLRAHAARTIAAQVNGLALAYGRAFSDDGTRLVYAADTSANASQVFLYDARNEIIRRLTSLNSRVTDVELQPTISGDGQRVAFATRRSVIGGNSDASVELYLYDLPTNRFSRLTNAPAAATAEVVASLSDDGSRIVFNFPRVLSGAVTSADFANDSEIYIADLPERAPFNGDLRLTHGASFGHEPSPLKVLAPSQIAIANGANLSLLTAYATRLADGSFPTTLNRTSVSVNGRLAQLLYVSPTQINFQVPPGTEPGAARVAIVNHDGYEARGTMQIINAAPGVFTLRGDGTGEAVAIDADTLTAPPFDPADSHDAPRRITVFATGLRHASTITATVGGRAAQVDIVAPSIDLPGLDELHLTLPRTLAGAGTVALSLSTDNRAANPTTIRLSGTRRPTSISLVPASATLGVGRSVQLRAVVLDQAGEPLNNLPLTFTSSDANIITVDPIGRARALRPGAATISVASGSLSATASLQAVPLSVVINEVLIDPPDGLAGDANRDGVRSAAQDEFIELVNAGTDDLDLAGYQLLTRNANNVDVLRHTFPADAILPAGTSFIVFGGAQAATFNPEHPAFGGARVSTASTGGLSLLNSGGAVMLLDPSGALVEQFIYGGTTDLDGDRNQSLTRAPDIYGDFAPHTSFGGSDARAFSPGTRIDGTPFQFTNSISRIEVSPVSVTLNTGAQQQFNAQAFGTDGQPLAGVIFRWQSSDTNVATIDRQGLATARTIGATAINAFAAGVTSAPASLSVVSPLPRVARVSVASAQASINRGGTQRFVAQAFDQNDQPVSGVVFTWQTSNPAIATIAADGTASGVGVGNVTLTARAADGVGGQLSGQATLTVRVPLVINELLADVPPDDPATPAIEGDANHDGVRSADDDEFIELLNNSDSPIDLAGIIIADATANRFTLPAGTTLAPNRALLIFGGGNPPANDPNFGGALVLKTSSLGLNDAGDTVTLTLPLSGTNVLLTSQSYGTADARSVTPAPTDQSLTRAPDAATDTFGGGFVAHTVALDAANRTFSPGTRVDGTPFGSAPITRIEVTPDAATLEVGMIQRFRARVFAEVNGVDTEITHGSVIWDVSDRTRATLAPLTGSEVTLTGTAAGTINVRARIGTRQSTSTLTITPIVASLSLAPSSATVTIGDQQTFTATARDASGQTISSVAFVFSLSDASAADAAVITASTSNTVTVRGNAAGAVNVVARYTRPRDGTVLMAVSGLTINAPPPRIARVEVTPADTLTTLNRGQQQLFSAIAFDTDNRPVSGASFTWNSDNAAIASISSAGLARGVGVGTVVITASTPDNAGGMVSAQAMLRVQVPLVLNEFLADPPGSAAGDLQGDANRDGVRDGDDDEFIELLNHSDAPIDLSGITVSDATNVRYTFPAATTLAAGRAVVIFGGGAPPVGDPAFGGALIATTTSLGLNNSGDTINVRLSVGGADTLLVAQAYGASGTPPAPTDQSLTRTPDATTGMMGGDFVNHLAAPNAATRVFSPGTRADGTPFNSAAISRLEIAPATAALDINQTRTFVAHAFTDASGIETELTNVSFVWDASDAARATLTPATGATTTVTARAAGSVNVRARAGGREATATLTINPPPPALARVELTPANAAINRGAAQTFNARAYDQFDQPFAGATFAFDLDDANIATVEAIMPSADGTNANAQVRGNNVGTANLTARATSGTFTVRSNVAVLNVNQPPPTISRVVVTPSTALIGIGASQPFTARAFDANDQEISGVAFMWASSAPSVATINAGGLATGTAAGQTQITATAGNVTSAPARLAVARRAAAGDLVFNEVLANPGANADANRDGTPGGGTASDQRDEFVELLNVTDAPVDLSLLNLYDNTTTRRHQFPANTILQAGAAIIVFGGETGTASASHIPGIAAGVDARQNVAPNASFGGALVQVASSYGLTNSPTSGLGLNNTATPADVLRLVNGTISGTINGTINGTLIAQAAFPAPTVDRSFSRADNESGGNRDFAAADLHPQIVAPASPYTGKFFSPGFRRDGLAGFP